MPEPFSIAATSNGDQATIVIAGELDLAHSSHARQVIKTALRHHRLVVVDLQKLTFIDSAGLHAFIHSRNSAIDHRATLELHNASEAVHNVFAITGLAFMLKEDEPSPDVPSTG